jgi:uncharacterized protein YkwD
MATFDGEAAHVPGCGLGRREAGWHTRCLHLTGVLRARGRLLLLRLTLVAAVLALLPVALGHAQPSPETPTAATGRKADLATGLNAARVKAGQLPLAESPELDTAAQAHSDDMRDHDYLDHEAPDGSQPQDRAAAAGYRVPPASAWIVVEVISAISADAAGPLHWWLDEDPSVHGKVLLDPRWREFGVGYAEGGRYGNYWTVLVGCRPGVVPTVVFQGVSYQHTERCGPPGSSASALAAPAGPGTTTTAAPPAASAPAGVAPPGSSTSGGPLRRQLMPF